jgi:murein DD-endopeptidase MepM/ murein hydrolase activator NlpD
LLALAHQLGSSGTPVGGGVNGVSAAPRGDSGTIPFLRSSAVLTTVPSLLVRHQAEVEATVQVETEASDAAADAAEAAAPPAPEPQPAFFTYTVQPGETVSSIAASFGIDPAYISWNNPEIADPDLLLVGANILIPSTNGIVYHVTLGDTLTDIAAYYQIDVQSIIGFVPNGLSSADAVIEGAVLLLPNATPPPPPVPAAVEVIEEPAPAAAPQPAAPQPAPQPAAAPVSPAVSGFAWPYYGNITTYFGAPRGAGYHRGIDIDGFGNYGAPIGAAAGGVVVLAAWDDWGLGYHVKIQHADGSITVYGHLSEIWVTQGQTVGQGEAVGALGSTGYSTGPHLHFELWVGGVPVDPLLYLA